MMTFYHPYYMKELQADRERQIKKASMINEIRRAMPAPTPKARKHRSLLKSRKLVTEQG